MRQHGIGTLERAMATASLSSNPGGRGGGAKASSSNPATDRARKMLPAASSSALSTVVS